jgi:hypothetical protein
MIEMQTKRKTYYTLEVDERNVSSGYLLCVALVMAAMIIGGLYNIGQIEALTGIVAFAINAALLYTARVVLVLTQKRGYL